MRLEGQAIAGYFPTPERLVPWISRHLKVSAESTYALLDPCAGEGAALLGLHAELSTGKSRTKIYAVEMEANRFQALHSSLTKAVDWSAIAGGNHLLHGDAFKVEWGELGGQRGASVLWLNPPYDRDPHFKRLEQRFLHRYTDALHAWGVLVFIIPVYALSASAETLACQYDCLQCYRFPLPEWNAYKQVVLFARRRETPLWEPDAACVARILAWEQHPESIPELREEGQHPFQVQAREFYLEGFDKWNILPVDLPRLLSEIRPWHQTDRGGVAHPISGILPEVPLEDLLTRRFPLAMPPRSAHIAAGIAAGVFNGARIVPDDPASTLPPLLVKGVFNKEFKAVDEKTNKDGDVTGVIEIQQPKLVTTVLDLRSHKYHTIVPSAAKTNPRGIESATMADLLDVYGRGLMHVMLNQCPIMHDPSKPEHAIALPLVKRTLFKAQSHATQAAVKLLGGLKASRAARRGKAAYVLGEIGSGKTTVALTAAVAIQAKRVLVLCPPHLLDSWREQVAAVLDDAHVEVLSDTSDVERVASDRRSGLIVSLLSRETAKLGHAWASVPSKCPKCGGSVPSETDLAKGRVRCQRKTYRPADAIAQLLQDLAVALLPTRPSDLTLRQCLPSRHLYRCAIRFAKRENDAAAWPQVQEKLGSFQHRVAGMLRSDWENASLYDALLCLLAAQPNEILTEQIAREMAVLSDSSYMNTPLQRAQGLLLLLPNNRRQVVSEELRVGAMRSAYSDPWSSFDQKVASLETGRECYNSWDWLSSQMDEEGTRTLQVKKCDMGSAEIAACALSSLAKIAKFERSEECGEFLFQAIPEPRRYPLARYITRNHPRLFDLLILDECHEYSSSGGSAQEKSAHRLSGLGMPALYMTGTVMNGYAESLFANSWALSPDFRAEFNRDDCASFVNRYGYRKRIVEDRDKETGKVVAFGSMTDRVERSARMVGNAPGLLPLFVLKHLLPAAVTLHKADLSVDIPECTNHVVKLPVAPELAKKYEHLKAALLRQIKADKFDPELGGKLWGALAELPAYLDLATSDTGNQDDGSYAIRYPESVGGRVVATVEPVAASEISIKEQWILDKIQEELAEGRNVLVFGWHTVLLPRLARLIQGYTGKVVPILDPGKVSTKKRQAWIDKEIVKKGRRVMVVNPVAIQTGLNNLVHFSTAIWVQNPACNPITARQAIGRIDRIGQESATRVFFPVYEGTTQEALHSLLLHKVAVSMSTDGLDAESALQAAGIIEDTFSGFSVGRQLYAILEGR